MWKHALLLENSACTHYALYTHTQFVYSVHDSVIMGNTSLVTKAFSKRRQQQQLHHKPVCSFQSIPTGERWSDVSGGGGGGKWQKIGEAELTGRQAQEW